MQRDCRTEPPPGLAKRLVSSLNLLSHDFSHPELLNFPGDRHRKFAGEPDVPRDLEGRDLAATEIAKLLFGSGHTVVQPDPRADLLAVLLIGHADDLHVAHFLMRVQKVFDLPWRDVLPASDDHVLDATG